jgi:hypothetical protein
MALILPLSMLRALQASLSTGAPKGKCDVASGSIRKDRNSRLRKVVVQLAQDRSRFEMTDPVHGCHSERAARNLSSLEIRANSTTTGERFLAQFTLAEGLDEMTSKVISNGE